MFLVLLYLSADSRKSEDIKSNSFIDSQLIITLYNLNRLMDFFWIITSYTGACRVYDVDDIRRSSITTMLLRNRAQTNAELSDWVDGKLTPM